MKPTFATTHTRTRPHASVCWILHTACRKCAAARGQLEFVRTKLKKHSPHDIVLNRRCAARKLNFIDFFDRKCDTSSSRNAFLDRTEKHIYLEIFLCRSRGKTMLQVSVVDLSGYTLGKLILRTYRIRACSVSVIWRRIYLISRLEHVFLSILSASNFFASEIHAYIYIHIHTQMFWVPNVQRECLRSARILASFRPFFFYLVLSYSLDTAKKSELRRVQGKMDRWSSSPWKFFLQTAH